MTGKSISTTLLPRANPPVTKLAFPAKRRRKMTPPTNQTAPRHDSRPHPLPQQPKPIIRRDLDSRANHAFLSMTPLSNPGDRRHQGKNSRAKVRIMDLHVFFLVHCLSWQRSQNWMTSKSGFISTEHKSQLITHFHQVVQQPRRMSMRHRNQTTKLTHEKICEQAKTEFDRYVA